jgi:hypothetical protein
VQAIIPDYMAKGREFIAPTFRALSHEASAKLGAIQPNSIAQTSSFCISRSGMASHREDSTCADANETASGWTSNIASSAQSYC